MLDTHVKNRMNESTLREALARFVRSRLQEAKWAGVFILLISGSQVHGLAVHDLQVASHLGERLNAIVTVEAAPGEKLSNSCFSVTSAAAGGLPGINDVSIAVSRLGNQAILRLTSSNIVVEPLSEVVIHVNCPDLPRISRSYMIMLDPVPLAASSQPVFNSQQSTADIGNTPDTGSASLALSIDGRFSAPAATGADLIEAGTRYRVQNGDTLSEVASRVADRPEYSVWRISRSIYAANPDAFLGGSPDMLINGMEIYIPPLSSALSSQREVPWSPSAGASANKPTAAIAPEYIVDNEPVYAGDAEPVFDPEALTLPTNDATPAAGTTQVTAASPQTGPSVLVGKLVLAGSLSTLSMTRVQMRNAGLATDRPIEVVKTVSQDPAPRPAPGKPDAPIIAVPDPKAVTATGRGGLRWLPWALLGMLLIAAPFAWKFVSERLREAQLRAVREILRRREHRATLVGAGAGADTSSADSNIDIQAKTGWAPAALNPHSGNAETIDGPATLVPVSHRPEETYIVEETMESGIYRRLAEQFPDTKSETESKNPNETRDTVTPQSTEKVPSIGNSVDFDLGDPASVSSATEHVNLENPDDTRSLKVDESLLEASYGQLGADVPGFDWEQSGDEPAADSDLIGEDLDLADVDSSGLPDDPAAYYHLEDAPKAEDPTDQPTAETLSLEGQDAPADIADTAKIVMFRRHAQKPAESDNGPEKNETDDSDDVAENNN